MELERIRETVDEGGQVLYIENTEHLNFADVQFISPIGSIRLHALVDWSAFRRHFRGENGQTTMSFGYILKV
ncbi:hypothetical protein QF049_006179 [Paenibacillus sp. W4I10]|nr:hypothetical protein [Paenibacillus sp. W4I10]